MIRRNSFLLFCLIIIVFIILILGKSDWHSNKIFSSSGNVEDYFDSSQSGGDSSRISLFQLSKRENLKGEENNQENKTVVLMWTKYYAIDDEWLMSLILSGRKWDPGCCTGDDLIVTLDRNMLPNATVVIFYNIHGNLNITDLPPARSPNQLWVLFSKESPAHSHPALQQFPDMFNWTMSYRRDSDIYSPYGFTQILGTPIPPGDPIMMPGNVTLSTWVTNKTDILAAVISHCATRSKRERVLQALQNSSLPVETFGGCGKNKLCHRTNKSCDHDKFWHELASKYKFYFAGENSLCVDYITEKFWRTLEIGIVPVAYGGCDYSAVAPPGSFIDISKFRSTQEVVDYLKWLANDPVEYSKYFEWKRKYRAWNTDGWGGWCTLCRLARQYKNNPHEMDISPYKSYKDLREWYNKDPTRSKHACIGPPIKF